MTGSSFGTLFKITTFGESHGEKLGVIIDGCPPQIPLSAADIQHDVDRRRPGQSKVTTQRKENDVVHIVSGVFEGKTSGAPIGILFENKDTRSEHYEPIKDKYRPGHADFTFDKKFGHRDWRGGGRSSGRETVCRVAAGAVAKKILASHGVKITGFVSQVGSVQLDKAQMDLSIVEDNPIRCPHGETAKEMEEVIMKSRGEGDSVGGIVEVQISGCPPGLGAPCFDKLEADLAKAMMSIGAVKGFDIGSGFSCASIKGSEHNDWMDETGFQSNNAGGVLGGISTGQDINMRLAVKPASSIVKEQETINRDGSATTIQVGGRHDPCLCPRVVPVAESMAALVLVDHVLRQKAVENITS